MQICEGPLTSEDAGPLIKSCPLLQAVLHPLVDGSRKPGDSHISHDGGRECGLRAVGRVWLEHSVRTDTHYILMETQS